MKNKNRGLRYCVVCEKKRRFTLNKDIGHSECQICGSRCVIGIFRLLVSIFARKDV